MYIEGFGNMSQRRFTVVRNGYRLRTVLMLMTLQGVIMFYAGAYYNATRIMDSVGLPPDTSVIRDISRYEMDEPIALEQMR